jgi:hypothetical protein
MSDVLDLSRFTDGGLEAARYALASCAGWKTAPEHLSRELREMAELLDLEIKARSVRKPHVGWRPRVVRDDGEAQR